MSENIAVNFSRTTGKFKYNVVASVAPSVVKALAVEGLIRLIQGKTLGGWEKSVAFPGKDEKRPKVNGEGQPWTRGDIEFNEANAEALAKALKGLEVNVADDDSEAVLEDAGIETVTVEQYDGAKAVEPKFKAEKELLKLYLFEADGTTTRKLKSGDDRSVESFCASRGLVAPTEPWNEDTVFLRAVKDWQKEQDRLKMEQE